MHININRTSSNFILTFLLTTVIGLVSAFGLVPLETTFQMKTEVKDMRMAMTRLHFTEKTLEDEEYVQLISNYMERMDSNFTYFLKSDELLWEQRFGKTLKNNYLEKNELYPAFYIFNTLESRIIDRMEWIKVRLNDDIDLFEEDTINTNDEDKTWPNTKEEMDQRWNQRLKNDILNEIVPDIRKELEEHYDEETIPDISRELLDELIGSEKLDELIVEAKTKIIERYERWQKRISDMKPAEVQENFLTELAQLYDPHSNFMSPDTSEDFGISISNELIGIGAVLQDDNGYCKIVELIDGGPAKKSGQLKKDDAIIGVAQGRDEFVDVVGKRLRDIVSLIRGKENSLVRLQVQSENSAEDKIINIIRKRIKIEEKLASAKVFEIPSANGLVPIGVINLPNFYGPTNGNPRSNRASDDVELLINKLKLQKVEGIVLDLRNNGGGLLDEAINITGLFISDGPVVKVKNRSGDVEVNKDYDPRISWEGPLAVLTSRYSASASEIVAGALQYYKRAVVIGSESTHGKGTVQTTFPLPISIYDMYGGSDNKFVQPNFLERIGRVVNVRPSRRSMPSMAKITIAKYYLPDGSSTQLRGVLSDITLPSIGEILPIRESDLDNPLVWDNIDGNPIDFEDLISNSYPYLQPNLVNELTERSQQRQTELEEFSYLNESIESFRERFEREDFPLSVLDRINMINADNREKDDLDAYNDRLNEFAYEFVEVPLKEPKPEEAEPAEEEPETVSTAATEDEATDSSNELLAENTSETSVENEDADEEEDDDTPSIDIHLRECMRIVGDWIEIEKVLNSGSETRQIAIKSMESEFASNEFHWREGTPAISTN